MMKHWLVGALLVVALGGCVGHPQDDSVSATPVTEETRPAQLCPPFCPPEHEVRIHPNVLNSTTRPTSTITPVMLDAMRNALASDSSIDIDEGGDPTNTNHALQIQARLKSIGYASGITTARVELVVRTYPGLALKGTLSSAASMAGIATTTQEMRLISAATENSTETFMTHLDDY